MDTVSRSGRGFSYEDDEDEDESLRRDGTSQKVDFTVNVDGKNVEQKQPSTPRSKHSATEQRRRSKINDRFQILRDLIPNSDQKRDKASFLLEVIEYIGFLHEKLQKYEAYPEVPWNNTQGPGDGSAAAYMFSGNDNGIAVAPTLLSNLQNPTESDPNLFASLGRGTAFTQPQHRLISESNNVASHSQWVRPTCPGDGTSNSDMLNEQEELMIDEGTISMSHTYSQGLLATLTQSLESSGLDLSQASISVQINLGKRAKRPTATTTSSAKDPDDPSSGNRASSGEESEQASKRRKSDT